MTSNLGLQGLPVNTAVLMVGQLAGHQNGDQWFSQEDIERLYETLRLPPPSGLARSLGQLKSQGLLRRQRTAAKITLTPLGIAEAAGHVGSLSQAVAISSGSNSAEFASAVQTTLSPAIAPNKWKNGIQRLLARFPFETNVFLITRFPDPEAGNSDVISAVLPILRQACSDHGLKLHVASDRQIEDDLWGNVGGYIWACKYAIGILETQGVSATLNDNVLIEIGSMLTLGRRCMIMKDPSAPTPPTDLAGQIYKTVDLTDEAAINAAAHRWIAEDLAFGPCGECP